MTPAELLAAIASLEARIATFAGVTSQAFADQSTSFNIDQAHKELARLRGLLATANTGSSTRYAATSKGV